MVYHFNVAPRYTAGSPAMVPEDIAERVAREEKHFIEHALSGAWGEAQKARAEKLGLRGVAERVRETSKGWEVLDLCTEEKYLRLFPDKLRKQGWRQYPDLDKWEKDLLDSNPPALDDYQHRGWFKVEPVMILGHFSNHQVVVYEPRKITD